MAEKTDDHDRPERRSGKPKRTAKGGDPHGSSTQEKARGRPPEPSEAGAGVRLGGGSTSKGGTGRWRSLAQLTISVEAFCEEATRFSNKWSMDFIDEKKRPKAAQEADKLAGWGKEVRNRAMQFLGRLISQPTDSQPRQVEAAWRRLQAVDLATRLQTVIEQLEQTRDRLREQYSTECMNRIDEDFRSLTKEVVRLNSSARTVRESLRIVLGAAGFRTAMLGELQKLCHKITEAITGTTEGVGDTWLEHGRFSTRMPERKKRVEAIQKAYESLLKEVGRDRDARLKAALGGDEREFRKITDFRETLEEVLTVIRSTAEYAISTHQRAACGVDETIASHAKTLLDAINELRITFKKLEDMFLQYKGIVGRAPFKRMSPVKPMPPWERLSQRQQHLVSTLVSLRRHDPAQEWYAVAKKVLEERLGLHENDSTLNRDLQLLEDEYGIVGKYPPPPNAEQQQTAYGYWIEEYAYKLYGPRMLGSDGS